MTEDLTKHVENAWTVRQYIKRFAEGVPVQDIIKDLKPSELTDISGAWDDASKTMIKLVDAIKDHLKTLDGKEHFGNRYKAKKTVSNEYEIVPSVGLEEITPEQIPFCVKIVKKKFETFVPKARIEEIQTKTGEKISVKLETIVKS